MHFLQKLFLALAKTAEQQMNDFNPHDLANMAWAFATVNALDEKLLTALP